MTAREIMVRAHELARGMEGDYSARLALALRQAWFEARLIASGGKLWERGEHRRLYFNDLMGLYGLEVDRYNTGNISHATLDGEQISNSSARQIADMLGWGKFWYDLNTGKFASRDISQTAFDRMTEKLLAS